MLIKTLSPKCLQSQPNYLAVRQTILYPQLRVTLSSKPQLQTQSQLIIPLRSRLQQLSPPHRHRQRPPHHSSNRSNSQERKTTMPKVNCKSISKIIHCKIINDVCVCVDKTEKSSLGF